jgi:hypothetical protein
MYKYCSLPKILCSLIRVIYWKRRNKYSIPDGMHVSAE